MIVCQLSDTSVFPQIHPRSTFPFEDSVPTGLTATFGVPRYRLSRAPLKPYFLFYMPLLFDTVPHLNPYPIRGCGGGERPGLLACSQNF